MMFFTRNKAPSSGHAAADFSPQGEAKGLLSRVFPWGRARRAAPGEESFSSSHCAIWHDITRALDAAQAASKTKRPTR